MFFNLNTHDLKNPKYKQNTFNKTFYNKKDKTNIFSFTFNKRKCNFLKYQVLKVVYKYK